METISLTRKNLYDQVWTETVAAFCLKYDVPEEGVEDICSRLNVPMPGIGHWRKLKQGKRSDWTPLPTESRGTESVVLYKRNDDLLKEEHVRNIGSLLVQAGNASSDIKPDENVFDKLILSTKEGMFKHWQVQHTYREKNRLLAIDVSPDNSCRALQIMDLFVKLLRFKGFDISVDQRVTFALIDGERISNPFNENHPQQNQPRHLAQGFSSGIHYLLRSPSYHPDLHGLEECAPVRVSGR